MIKRILSGICDPLYTVSVAKHTTDIAKKTSANVTGISVNDIARLRNVGPVAVGAAEYARQMVATRIEKDEKAVQSATDILVRLCDAENVPCTLVNGDGGSPFRQLLDTSRYHDLMVFGLKGLFDHGVIDEPPHELIQLIESGVQPVLAVGAEYREINRVLIAYSGSVESAKTIRDFVQVNAWPDATIRLIYVAKKPGDGPVLLSEMRDYLTAHGYEVEAEFVKGNPKKEVLREAEDWKADLLVVGNSAKSLLRRRVFGETALSVIAKSNLPLFLSQ